MSYSFGSTSLNGMGRGVLLRQYLDSQTNSSPRQSSEPNLINFEGNRSSSPKNVSIYSQHIPRVPFDELQFSPDDNSHLADDKTHFFSFGNISDKEDSSTESYGRENSKYFYGKSSRLRGSSDSDEDSQIKTDIFRKNKSHSNDNMQENDTKLFKSRQSNKLEDNAYEYIVSSENYLNQHTISSDYTIGHMIQRMEKSCGILHGKINSKPISNIAELELHPTVYSSLCDKKVDNLTRSQMFGIPVLLQRRNLILVGPSLTGKTFACVIGIMSLLFDKEFYDGLPDHKTGPRFVFLTSNSCSVREVGHQCKVVGNNELRVLTAHGGGLEKERSSDLANGCDVLVTTPRCWLRLLMLSVTNMDRLCHIVFDDSDILFTTFKQEMATILLSFNKLLEIRKKNNYLFDIHVAIVGEKWTKSHNDCLRIIKSPVVAITSHLEAALYSRIKPIACIISNEAKLSKLLELLEKSKNYRTIVMCQSADEIKTLRPHLSHSKQELIVAHEEMGFSDLCDICSSWERDLSLRIMLCSDSVLGQLAITDAQHLIHFSLPVNKSYFSERFSTIQDYFIDRVQYPEIQAPHCWVNILIDNQNVKQFPEIISFLERLNTPIPQAVKDIIKAINRQNEEEKIHLSICDDILKFGRCQKAKKCKKRHIFFKEIDAPKKLPESGLIKMKCLLIHDPSHYSVRILATKEKENDQWIDFNSNYAIIGFKMAKYYRKRTNRIPHGKVNVGDIVTVETEVDTHYKRARVTEILSRDSKQNPVNIVIHLIDEGATMKCKALTLLHLPQELQIYEEEAYNVYISGILPVDYDPMWSEASKIKLREGFQSAISDAEDNFFVAKIELTVGNNLITSSFLCYEWLEGSHCYRVLFSPRKFILGTHLAEPNDDHMPDLLNLASEAKLKFECPTDQEEKMKKIEEITEDRDLIKQKSEPIRWAHLDKDDFILTFVPFFDSPSLFYLQIRNNFELLSALEKELSRNLDNHIIKPKRIYKGMVCAVKNSDSLTWNRALVLDIVNNVLEVFCVDYGDILNISNSEISLLPESYISRLPFQAIECSLVGVSSTDLSNWSDDAVNHFKSLITNDKGEMKCLYAKVCELIQSDTTGSNHYQVLLVDYSKDSLLLLNKELISSGFATWASDSTKKYVSDSSYLNFFNSIEVNNVMNNEEHENKDADCDYSEEMWTEESTTDPEKVGKAVQTLTSSVADENSKKVNEVLELLKKSDFDIEFSIPKLKEFSTPVVDFLPTNLKKILQYEKPSPKPLTYESKENKKDAPIEDDAVNDTNEYLRASDFVNDDGEIHEDYDLIVLFENFLPFIKENEVKVLRPTIVWSQTDFSVKISIMVPDIQDYLINCCFQQVIFKCVFEKKIYAFELKLFGPVNKDKVQYVLLGQHFDVIMHKWMPGNWPRLTYEKMANGSWIKSDAESLIPKNLNTLELASLRGESRKETSEEYQRRMEARELELKDPYSRIPDIYTDSEKSNGSVASDFEEYDDL